MNTITKDQPTVQVDWPTLVDREPQLRLLRARASGFRQKVRKYQARDRFFYETLKPKLEQTVGWYRRGGDPLLTSTEAYEVAYDELATAVGLS